MQYLNPTGQGYEYVYLLREEAALPLPLATYRVMTATLMFGFSCWMKLSKTLANSCTPTPTPTQTHTHTDTFQVYQQHVYTLHVPSKCIDTYVRFRIRAVTCISTVVLSESEHVLTKYIRTCLNLRVKGSLHLQSMVL